MNTPLQDDSPMPFGMHKDKLMQDVPASYLYWLWEEEHINVNTPVGDYIKRSMSVLKEETPDKIWNRKLN